MKKSLLKISMLALVVLLFALKKAEAQNFKNPFRTCENNSSSENIFTQILFSGLTLQVNIYDSRSRVGMGSANYKIVKANDQGSTYHVEAQIGGNLWQMIAQQKSLVLNINTQNGEGRAEMSVYADGVRKSHLDFPISCKK